MTRLILNVTETPVVDRKLEVGAQTEQITVEASVETLQTTSSSLGTTIGSRQVTELPLSSRNFTQILGLSAGASAPVNNATAFGKGTLDIAVNGNDTMGNNFQMDGVAVNNIANSGSANDSGIYAGIGIPSPDALQEFRIQTSTYDASYGRNAGANVNVITKSGTNAFHGAAFEFFRNADLNANGFFYNRNVCPVTYAGESCPHQVLNQNQFGGVIGGPIKKDKMFFFASYEGLKNRNGISPEGNSSGIVLPPIPGEQQYRPHDAAIPATIDSRELRTLCRRRPRHPWPELSALLGYHGERAGPRHSPVEKLERHLLYSGNQWANGI